MTAWTVEVQLNDQAANEFDGKSNRLASEGDHVFPISWSDSLQKKKKKEKKNSNVQFNVIFTIVWQTSAERPKGALLALYKVMKMMP